ncbi:MAG: alanine--tRNA ligase [Chloroflexota bacterium]
MTGDTLRQAFLDFFQEKGHTVVPSASLVPHRDPSLLLTSAGMVQFKPYFLGVEVPPNPRLTSCQKCFRTTDIESVGDTKHLTFFEMLGNFSVGDYFKKEAIEWAWEFVTERLRLRPERLWASVYLDDDEAFEHWRRVGVPEERILRFGDEDNFWGPAGDSGPCGPCSELHYDMGKEYGCGRPDCKPNCECGRFSEIWNLVFTQYDQNPDGSRSPLPRPNIDTGMGLERIAAAVQGTPSVYETDLFRPLMEEAAKVTGMVYGETQETDRALRIIVEHSRGICFLVADGVLPANEGRGYILRRILRRASLFGRRLGMREPFLTDIGHVTIERMSHVYPELRNNHRLIDEVIRAEEHKFIATLEGGLPWVEELVDRTVRQGEKQLAGADVFRLYDERGFPPELTTEMAAERGVDVDMAGFEREMEKQRERAREGQTVETTGIPSATAFGAPAAHTVEPMQCEFVGYDTHICQSRVVGLRAEGNAAETVREGQSVEVLLAVTPFYGEMGGQAGDTGRIVGPSGEVMVEDTSRGAGDLPVHRGKVVHGSMALGDNVKAEIDLERRLDIARNHTATHLLQAALREIVGTHVTQRGSLVEADRFRFDFSQVGTISHEQLMQVGQHVNARIRQNVPVYARYIPYEEAIKSGAIALFEEKYANTVRVLEIGQPPVSRELCGGTHVRSTGEIGFFMVLSESSVGTGLRRIEAATGRGAERVIEARTQLIRTVASELDSGVDELPSRVRTIMNELEDERRRRSGLERELSRAMIDPLIGQTTRVDSVPVLAARVASLSPPVLREMGDILRDRLGSAVIVLGTVRDRKPHFIAFVTQDLADRGLHAGKTVSEVAKVTGGGGGGRPNMAQAGGRDPSKLDDALGTVPSIVARWASGLTQG